MRGRTRLQSKQKEQLLGWEESRGKEVALLFPQTPPSACQPQGSPSMAALEPNPSLVTTLPVARVLHTSAATPAYQTQTQRRRTHSHTPRSKHRVWHQQPFIPFSLLAEGSLPCPHGARKCQTTLSQHLGLLEKYSPPLPPPPSKDRERPGDKALDCLGALHVRTHECLSCCHPLGTRSCPQSKPSVADKRMELGSMVKSVGHWARLGTADRWTSCKKSSKP